MTPYQHIADGTHAASGLRWYLQRVGDVTVCTVNGYANGGPYQTHTCELAGATEAHALVFVADVLGGRAPKRGAAARASAGSST